MRCIECNVIKLNETRKSHHTYTMLVDREKKEKNVEGRNYSTGLS